MIVKDVKVVLLQAQKDGRLPSSTDVGDFIELLSRIDERELADVVKAMAPAVNKLAKPVKTKTAAKPKVLNEALVSRYLGELQATRDDNAAFEAIVARIGTDRTVKVAEAVELATRFTVGSALRLKTKRDAMKALLDRQITDKRAAARAPQISELF